MHGYTQVRPPEVHEGLVEEGSEGWDARETGAQTIPLWNLQTSYQIYYWKNHPMQAFKENQA